MTPPTSIAPGQGDALSEAALALLRCPISGQALHRDGPASLRSADGTIAYPIVHGVPVLLADAARRGPAPQATPQASSHPRS